MITSDVIQQAGTPASQMQARPDVEDDPPTVGVGCVRVLLGHGLGPYARMGTLRSFRLHLGVGRASCRSDPRQQLLRDVRGGSSPNRALQDGFCLSSAWKPFMPRAESTPQSVALPHRLSYAEARLCVSHLPR